MKLSICACSILLAALLPGFQNRGADPQLLAEVRQIRAIDNHAHPVRVTGAGEKPDRDFDALPVDNMEPSSDPINSRPGAPGVAEAARALYGSADPAAKQRVMREKGNDYPAWVLDQAGIEVMLANRIELGTSVQTPRFRWVPYVDTLIFPLDNSALASVNPDRKAFFSLEDALGRRYLETLNIRQRPPTLSAYLSQIVTPTLERQKRGGALAEKFEAAYLRTLSFDKVDRATAERIYAENINKPAVPTEIYKPLQDFLFRFIASECGRLGMAVHIHTEAGGGSYFDIARANPLNLESVLNATELRKTKFVMIHGGWPFIPQITAMLTKPNAYLDFSSQDLLLPPARLAGHIRQWLEFVPEKVMFGTDAYPYSDEMGWEESAWVASRNGREALAIALTGMMQDGEISRARASELARMVMRENARALYGL